MMRKVIVTGLIGIFAYNTAFGVDVQTPRTPAGTPTSHLKHDFLELEMEQSDSRQSFVQRHPYLCAGLFISAAVVGTAGGYYLLSSSARADDLVTSVDPLRTQGEFRAFRTSVAGGDCLEGSCAYKGLLGNDAATLFSVKRSTDEDGSGSGSGSGSDDEEMIADRRLNIFGFDDRIKPDMTQYPARTIGRIEVPVLDADGNLEFFPSGRVKIATCTATMISRELILTNKHCTGFEISPDVYPQAFYDFVKFNLGYVDGQAIAESGVRRIITNRGSYQDDRRRDWAILQLNDALGDVYGWLGLQNTDISDFAVSRSGNMIGYSGDLKGQPGGHYNCASKGTVSTSSATSGVDSIRHDCDATRGSSGSAFFNDNHVVVALNYGEFRDGGQTSLELNDFSNRYANLMISTDNFAAAFNTAMNTWPKRPQYPGTMNPTPVPAPTSTPTPISTPTPTPEDSSDDVTSVGSAKVVAWTMTGGVLFVLLSVQ